FNSEIISVQLNIKTYAAYVSMHSFVYNFDVGTSKMITIGDLFVNENSELIRIIQNKIEDKYFEVFEIEKIPDLWFLTKGERGNIGVEFLNGFPEDATAGNDIFLFEVFV